MLAPDDHNHWEDVLQYKTTNIVKKLESIIDEHEVDVICLQEVSRYSFWIFIYFILQEDSHVQFMKNKTIVVIVTNKMIKFFPYMVFVLNFHIFRITNFIDCCFYFKRDFLFFFCFNGDEQFIVFHCQLSL